LQAQHGSVTTLMHMNLEIEDEAGKRFMRLLDGTRNGKH
jgi:hypothetical protein